MNYFDDMLEHETWMSFYEEKHRLRKMTPKEAEELLKFIEDKAYIPYVRRMIDGVPFSPPRKSLIGKSGSDRKRVVYTFPYPENTVLKMLIWKLKDHDHLFSDSLYSFRSRNGVQQAVHRLKELAETYSLYSCKIDISDYYNSIPVDLMTAMIRERVDDPALCRFFDLFLHQTEVISDGELITEEKGIMAGTPVSPFLANLYLADLDELFSDAMYARYADDIIVLTDTAEEQAAAAEEIFEFIRKKGLSVNPEKVKLTAPGEKWTYLGVSFGDGEVDISEVTKDKLKAKLHRKARALERWKRAKNVTAEQAARAYIRAVNRKLYNNPQNSELTWCRWYFPLITTDRSLKELDLYIQSCIRYVYFGNYGKKTYSLRYDDLKKLGYQNLVHRYYTDMH